MTIKPEVLAAFDEWMDFILAEYPSGEKNWAIIRAEIAEAVKDARRYRWLKKNDNAYLLAEDVIDDAMNSSVEKENDETL